MLMLGAVVALAYTTTYHNTLLSKHAAAELTLKVANPGIAIANGVSMPCYGPYLPPSGARSLRKFMPQVNMAIVHHMILFGGRGAQGGSPPGSSPTLCGQVRTARIVFDWHCGPIA